MVIAEMLKILMCYLCRDNNVIREYCNTAKVSMLWLMLWFLMDVIFLCGYRSMVKRYPVCLRDQGR